MPKPKYLPPVAVGDRLELTVETQGSSGEGLCHHEGYTLFVPEGLPGDVVTGEVVKTSQRFGVVRVLEQVKPSPDRVEPPCPVYPECGGCKFQSLRYVKQVEFKIQTIADSLKHIGGIEPPEAIRAIPAEKPYQYRNKSTFAVQRKYGKLRIGFFKQGTHEVIDSDQCDILVEPINAVKEWMRGLLEKHRVSIYDEKRRRGFFRNLMVRHSVETGKTLIGFITVRGKFPVSFLEELADPAPLKQFKVCGIVQNINNRNTNILLGKRTRVLLGKNRLPEQLGDLKFHLSLESFFQINPYQTVKLYDLIGQWSDLEEGTALDAYSGTGGIGLWLGKKGKTVTGIEEFPQAVTDAEESARLNGIKSCRFLQGTVEKHLPNIMQKEKIGTLILDPPRKGCSEKVIEAIEKMPPPQILYVSCNPATLARDLSRMTRYRIEELCMIDMFPQTQHVEAAVRLRRK